MSVYKYNINEYVQLNRNVSSIDINDMVKVCKRLNNTKREYLFVNKYLAKHVPVAPFEVLKVYDEFYNEIINQLKGKKNILVVGFAETATALAGYISYRLEKDGRLYHHLQTTRENINGIKLFEFLEEHSHAMEQAIFCEKNLEQADYLLFIEDEITTGNTIINFKNEFDQLIDIPCGVASLLNWQNASYSEEFERLEIERISLLGGRMLEDINPMFIDGNDPVTLSGRREGRYIEVITNLVDPRYGRENSENWKIVDDTVDKLVLKINEVIKNNYKKIEVIGTEEYMMIPLLVASEISNVQSIRATTRSPIIASDDSILNSSVQLASAYSVERKTFLYNVNEASDLLIVISDTKVTKEFKSDMEKLAHHKKCDLLLVEMRYANE